MNPVRWRRNAARLIALVARGIVHQRHGSSSARRRDDRNSFRKGDSKRRSLFVAARGLLGDLLDTQALQATAHKSCRPQHRPEPIGTTSPSRLNRRRRGFSHPACRSFGKTPKPNQEILFPGPKCFSAFSLVLALCGQSPNVFCLENPKADGTAPSPFPSEPSRTWDPALLHP